MLALRKPNVGVPGAVRCSGCGCRRPLVPVARHLHALSGRCVNGQPGGSARDSRRAANARARSDRAVEAPQSVQREANVRETTAERSRQPIRRVTAHRALKGDRTTQGQRGAHAAEPDRFVRRITQSATRCECNRSACNRARRNAIDDVDASHVRVLLAITDRTVGSRHARSVEHSAEYRPAARARIGDVTRAGHGCAEHAARCGRDLPNGGRTAGEVRSPEQRDAGNGGLQRGCDIRARVGGVERRPGRRSGCGRGDGEHGAHRQPRAERRRCAQCASL